MIIVVVVAVAVVIYGNFLAGSSSNCKTYNDIYHSMYVGIKCPHTLKTHIFFLGTKSEAE